MVVKICFMVHGSSKKSMGMVFSWLANENSTKCLDMMVAVIPWFDDGKDYGLLQQKMLWVVTVWLAIKDGLVCLI